MRRRLVEITQQIGAVVVIDLPDGDQPLGIRKLHGIRTVDVVTAFRLVEANVGMLLEQWRKSIIARANGLKGGRPPNRSGKRSAKSG